MAWKMRSLDTWKQPPFSLRVGLLPRVNSCPLKQHAAASMPRKMLASMLAGDSDWRAVATLWQFVLRHPCRERGSHPCSLMLQCPRKR